MTTLSQRIEKANPFLVLTFFALIIIGVPFDLLANPFDALVGKADSIYATGVTIAGIVAGGGIVWAGIKFVKGDPDAVSVLVKALIGAFIIYGAAEFVNFMAT